MAGPITHRVKVRGSSNAQLPTAYVLFHPGVVERMNRLMGDICAHQFTKTTGYNGWVRIWPVLLAYLANRTVRRLKYCTPYEVFYRQKNPVDVFAALRRAQPEEFAVLSLPAMQDVMASSTEDRGASALEDDPLHGLSEEQVQLLSLQQEQTAAVLHNDEQPHSATDLAPARATLGEIWEPPPVQQHQPGGDEQAPVGELTEAHLGFDPNATPKWSAGQSIEIRLPPSNKHGSKKHEMWIPAVVLGRHPHALNYWVWDGKRRRKRHQCELRPRSSATAHTVIPPMPARRKCTVAVSASDSIQPAPVQLVTRKRRLEQYALCSSS